MVQNASTVERRYSSWIGGSILASLVINISDIGVTAVKLLLNLHIIFTACIYGSSGLQ